VYIPAYFAVVILAISSQYLEIGFVLPCASTKLSH